MKTRNVALIGLSLILYAVTINSTAAAYTVTGQVTTLAFEDEFNGSSLDTTQWVKMNRPGDSSNSEVEYYLPTNVTESGGYLNILTKVDSSKPGYNYTSGMVQWNPFSFTYGTVEIRAKLAGGKGPWPALWLLGHNCQTSNITSADNTGTCNWPNSGSDEIDITEVYGGSLTSVGQNLYSGSYSNHCSASTTDVSQNWHIYSLVWGPGSLVWKIDGATTCTMTTGVPITPMFLIMNTALGGVGGTINNSTLPQTTQIDYVRVNTGQAGPINGSISCTSPVNSGGISICTITPNSGYVISYVSSNCGGSLSGNVFTTGAVTSNCTVSTAFVIGATATEPKPNPPTNLIAQ
jgi:beta-glucanase (GH16 family)